MRTCYDSKKFLDPYCSALVLCQTSVIWEIHRNLNPDFVVRASYAMRALITIDLSEQIVTAFRLGIEVIVIPLLPEEVEVSVVCNY